MRYKENVGLLDNRDFVLLLRRLEDSLASEGS